MNCAKMLIVWALVAGLFVLAVVLRDSSAAEATTMKAEVEQNMVGRYCITTLDICSGNRPHERICIVRLDTVTGQVQLLNAKFGVITLKEN